MDNTKKGKTTPIKLAAPSAPANKTQETVIPSNSEVLYFDIANSAHGIVKASIKKKKEEDKERIIKTELSEWKIPPVNKKENCESHKSPSPPSDNPEE